MGVTDENYDKEVQIIGTKQKHMANIHLSIMEKMKESAWSVLPIIGIVGVLAFTVIPIQADLMLCFLIGALLLIIGMGLFSMGAEISMTPIGNKIGTALTKTKNLPLILIVTFFLGFAITVSEPDLQVLAETVPHIDNMVLLITVGAGVGFFLSVCMLRIITGIHLRWLLIIFYGMIFLLAVFTDRNFLGIAFDSGGVTTGPMTVPFILALGMGVSYIRSDNRAEADSFGLVSLCSVGPILSVLILGFFYSGGDTVVTADIASYTDTGAIGGAYLHEIPRFIKEMAVAMLPIVLIFFLFHFLLLKLNRRSLLKICVGLSYTYTGLVLFLTGVNVGFSSLGTVIGMELGSGNGKIFLIPLAMLLGWFTISAEPAVAVLEKQIEEVSAGAIPGKAIKLSLSVAIAIAMGFTMFRVLTGTSILWFLIPGYLIALILTFFVPDIYAAIAFDSGGVASGPMTATFMLQFVIGASLSVGGNVLADAFGAVAMVAMMPLLSIQIVGLFYERRKQHIPELQEIYGDEAIIELWEVDKD